MPMNGARNFAAAFYKSKGWEKLSQAYRAQHPLCERCLRKGQYNPSELVHHIEEISETNYQDPEILYGEDNLEALCRKCHGIVHSAEEPTEFNEDGSLFLG